MKKILAAIIIIPFVLLTTGCAMPPPKPQMTPLQIQSMQTRTFKTTKRKAFNSTMQVFQDLGYTVKSANFNTGFISAQSLTKNAGSQLHGFGRFLNNAINNAGPNGERRSVSALTKATAFITKLPNKQIRIRVSFVDVSRVSINGGSPTENDKQILNGKTYTEMFNRVRQALFVGTAAA